MPGIVSSIKKHITETEFWRGLSLVLKRIESTTKYFLQLPLFFTFSLYILHLIRSGLRIVDYFYKTKNKNLGSTCKFLFAVFKVSIAITALILLGSAVPLPTILLTTFFAYSLVKLIHSLIVLFVSMISYQKIDKNCLIQQWKRAQYQQNINKHVYISTMILMGMLLTHLLFCGVSALIWLNPLLLLADSVICTVLTATSFYLIYKIIKNKRHENYCLTAEEIATIKKFLLLFGLVILALALIVAAPCLGISAITGAMIVLCVHEILLTAYYYFNPDYVSDPQPLNLKENQLNAAILQKNRDYYQTLSPILYLQTQTSESFQHVEELIKNNKKFLLKVTFIKLLEFENKLEKISKLNTISRFFSQLKKLKIKKEYLLKELAWALNTDKKEILIDLFIRAIIDLPDSKRSLLLENNLSKLMDLMDCLGIEAEYFIDYNHPLLNKNFIGRLFFMARQQAKQDDAEQEGFVKPKAFYQSFWKKVGMCEALSEAYRASWNIEVQLNLSHAIPSAI